MEVLPYSFRTLTLCGMRRPPTWSSWKRIIYDLYTIIVLISLYSFSFMQFVNAILSVGNIEDLISSSFMLVTTGNVCCKAANILSRRNDIVETLAMLDNEKYQRRSIEENRINEEFNKRIRKDVLCYLFVVGSAIFTVTLSSVIKNIPERSLPFKAWIPLNYSSENVYWYFYLHQVIAHGFAGTIGIAYDTFVLGIMLLICEQLKILEFRLIHVFDYITEDTKKLQCCEMNLERSILREFVDHHRDILQFAGSFNDYFTTVIFVQYAVSCFVICMSAYRLARMEITNPEYPFAVVYMLCVTLQIFYFCWYGNEVILYSRDIIEGIYQVNWTPLHLETQKNLLTMMNRAKYPIIFTSGKILVLSLESFMAIIKLSYTAFNFLQQT